jgi:hypothetical protein
VHRGDDIRQDRVRRVPGPVSEASRRITLGEPLAEIAAAV